MLCCSDELSEELGNLFGEHLDNKTEEEVLGEMWRLAVVAQNNISEYSEAEITGAGG